MNQNISAAWNQAEYGLVLEWVCFLYFSPKQIALYIAVLVSIVVVNVALRFLYTLVARIFGFCHPEHDAYWPRVPWRPFWRSWMFIREWFEQTFHIGRGQSAAWASTFTALSLQYRTGGVLLGRVRHTFGGWIQPIGLSNVERHLAMIAGSGSGKSVFLATIISLLKRKQSAFIVDPKGAITNTIVAKQRKRGRTCHVIDPKRTTNYETAAWNYLAEIPVLNARLGQDVTTLLLDKVAEADIAKTGNENTPFFPDSGRVLWGSLLAHVYLTEQQEKRTPIRARELLLHGYREHAETHAEAMTLLWVRMKNSVAFDGYVSAGGTLMTGGSTKSSADVLSTVRTATKYLDHSQVKRVMGGNTFHLTDLKGGSDFVFITAPTTDIRGTLSPMFRVITMCKLWIFEQIPGGLKDPTLVALDEFPSLGYIPDCEAAAPVMRGYGIRLLICAQDIEAMERVYPESWGGFLGNAEAVFWMGVGHLPTAQFLSSKLGRKTVKKKSGRGDSRQVSEHEYDLMTDDQIRRFLAPRRTNMIVTRFGERPIKAKLAPYYKELPVWLYDADPTHGDTMPRAWLRTLLDRLSTSPIHNHDRTISEADARAMFGLSGSYTQRDLETRASHISANFSPDLVHAARTVLERLL